MSIIRQAWKDFAEFWKTQVFWAFLVSAVTFLVQWRRGAFSGVKFRENITDNLIPYGAIVALFIIGNMARTLFITERDELRKKRRLIRREEHRAERMAELDRVQRTKPKPPKSNLQFRRIFQDRVWFGHEISGSAHDAITVEIGNELADRIVGDAEDVRAHVTYLDSTKKQLQIRCPGAWTTQQDEANIPTGESRFLLIAVLKGPWMSDMYQGIRLDDRITVQIRLIDKAGQPFMETIFLELGFGNERYLSLKRMQPPNPAT